MSPKAENRPREVTFGAVAVVILGVLVIARAFDALGGLESLETQKALRKALDSESARSLGIGIGTLTDVLHAVILVGAAATAVSIVTALFAVRGDTGARWGLLASGVLGGLGALMFDPVFGICLGGAAVIATISRRAATWFDGGTPPPPGGGPRTREESRGFGQDRSDHAGGSRPQAPHRPEARPGAGHDPDEGTGNSDRSERSMPAPTEGFGRYREPAVATLARPADPRPVRASAPRLEALPFSARAAVLLAWAGCLVAVVASIGAIIALVGDRTPFVTWAVGWLDLADASVSAGQIAACLVTALVVVVAWSLLTVVIAALVHLGNGSARMLLVMDAVVAVAAALAVLTSGGISSLAQLVSSIVLLAATATAVLLLSPSSAAYFGDHHPRPDRPAQPQSDPRDKDRLPPTW